jgi:prophage regulatory protein
MRLTDLLSTGKQIRTIPKSEIPGLLGEVEMLKAKLWLRLTEWEELQPVLVVAKTVRDKPKTAELPDKALQQEQVPRPEGRILRLKDVVRMVGLSRSTVWKMDLEGKFPKHRKLGPRSVGWLDVEIHEWIGTRQCGRTR